MDKELREFVKEGMHRYKEASRLMVLFGRTIEGELQNILKSRKKWGNFKPEKTSKSVGSTRYWSEYPFLNAKIFGKIRGRECTIRIAINWYQSEVDYPFYEICLEKGADEEIFNKFSSYNEQAVLEDRKKDTLFYFPKKDDMDLKRDFNKLIDEFIKII